MQVSSQNRKHKITAVKINAAKVFLMEKRYQVAQAILEATDDPEADQLLEKMPLVDVDTQRPAIWQKPSALMGLVGVVGILCLSLGFFLASLIGSSGNNTVSEPQQIELVIPTLTVDPELDLRLTDVAVTFEAYNASLTATAEALQNE